MKYFFGLLLLVLATHAQRRLGQRPNSFNSSFLKGVQGCYGKNYNEKQFNACLLQQVNLLAPKLAEGVQELNVPTLDPFVLKNVNLVQTEPPVAIDAQFRSIRVSGLSKMQFKYIHVPLKPPVSIRAGIVVPSLLMRGQYKIGGNIFSLPIEGDGNFISKLDTIIAEASADVVYDANNKANVKNVKVGFKIKDMNTKLGNLFEGNKVLSDTIHHFMRENGQLLLEEIRPELSKTIDSLMSTLLRTIFAASPTELSHTHLEVVKSGAGVA